jgi:hypothetical protein
VEVAQTSAEVTEMIEINRIREVYGQMNLGDWRAEKKRKVEERESKPVQRTGDRYWRRPCLNSFCEEAQIVICSVPEVVETWDLTSPFC